MSRPNPVKSFNYSKGDFQKRYYNCDHYDKCLTKASKKNWQNFTCAYCVFLKNFEKIRRDIEKRFNGNNF